MNDAVRDLLRKKKTQLSAEQIQIPAHKLVKAYLSLGYFAKHICGYQVDRHHREWCDLLQRYKRLNIIGPRDHSKTTIFSQAFPLWRIYWHKTEGTVISYNQRFANKILSKIRDTMSDNPHLRHLEPSFVDTKSQLKNKSPDGPNYELNAFSFMGSAGLGEHPDFIILDDVLYRQKGINMKEAKEYFDSTIVNQNPEWLVNTGSPIFKGDMLDYLEGKDSYITKRFPAISNEEKKEVLWPEMRDWNWLMRKKIEAGSLSFAQNYYPLKPVDDNTSLFPWDKCFAPNLDKGLRILNNPRPNCRYYAGVDFAFSESENADKFVIAVLEANPDGKIYVCDYYSAKGISGPEQLTIIKAWHSRWNFQLIGLEVNSIMAIVKDYQQSMLPYKLYRTSSIDKYSEEGTDSISKFNMVSRYAVAHENRQITIPYYEDDYTRERIEQYYEELSTFAISEGRLVERGIHSDLGIAFGYAYEALQSMEFSGYESDDLEPVSK